jgi:hypothetical protein
MKKILLSILLFVFSCTLSEAQTMSNPTNVNTISSSTFTYNQVAISNTPALIRSQNIGRRSLMIRNQGTVDMYIGGSSVSSDRGMLLKSNEVVILDRSYAAWYGITSTGTTTVGFVEE